MAHPNEPSIEKLEAIKLEMEALDPHPEDWAVKMLALNAQIRRRNKEAKEAKEVAEVK